VQLRRPLAATAAIAAALAGTTIVGTTSAGAGTAKTGRTASPQTVLVLGAKDGTGAETRAAISDLGGRVVDVNKAIGLYTVRTSTKGFAARAARSDAVTAAAKDVAIGYAPGAVAPSKKVEREHVGARDKGTGAVTATSAAAAEQGDPLDEKLWGLDMVDAFEAREVNDGDQRVRVGILDSGIDARQPDLAAQVDSHLSRNFVTDMPDIDGPCEFTGCQDPDLWDDSGHGTHVAGTVAAAADGFGLSGVAPGVTLVSIRGGQDSGFLFLKPVVDALTYGADIGLDVINMSFYVDPWLYNCIGGAPEDDAEATASQELILDAMTRALQDAHASGVTLVGSLGNNHEDLANPRTDLSSPDYPAGETYPRTIDDKSCFDMPVEGPHVLGVSALGPSERKADYSNYSTGLRGAQEIEISAPGGWFRDGLGTATYRTVENEILSTYPFNALLDEGQVRRNGQITPLGKANGVIKQCPAAADEPVECGWYAFLQGTSMASPHATGVAALAVSAHGSGTTADDFGLSPDQVRTIVMSSARNHPCPPGGVQSYTDVGRSAEFTASCTGSDDFNAFYGDGIVNAFRTVTSTG
jgi:lantibiotic leader peptide-processing serine protease